MLLKKMMMLLLLLMMMILLPLLMFDVFSCCTVGTCWCIVRAHQTHYEQFGQLTGAMNIGKYGTVELDVVGVRDHSYGIIHTFVALLLI